MFFVYNCPNYRRGVNSSEVTDLHTCTYCTSCICILIAISRKIALQFMSYMYIKLRHNDITCQRFNIRILKM